ncbi:hypothetical protein [Sphingopyxis sp. A083]|uniref:hypothetical protein n=1 Tax=Sphingopyxis sp. A083 TaxID=1759083 RepID=UPI000735FF23|nr:hypothetical protein [Sphingopyxis sp. A083]KTE74030.1 hypothetical protein ATE59_16500 [Sphingopyxis sp. A083]
MITEDDVRIAQTLAAEISAAAKDGKDVTVWLASGKVLMDVQSADTPGYIMTIKGSSNIWRFRADHVVGYSAA